eukprot:scaffold106042_cov42-Prasinocladus_malaysianus.AAC.8
MSSPQSNTLPLFTCRALMKLSSPCLQNPQRQPYHRDDPGAVEHSVSPGVSVSQARPAAVAMSLRAFP